jgi:hypothetical protein
MVELCVTCWCVLGCRNERLVRSYHPVEAEGAVEASKWKVLTFNASRPLLLPHRLLNPNPLSYPTSPNPMKEIAFTWLWNCKTENVARIRCCRTCFMRIVDHLPPRPADEEVYLRESSWAYLLNLTTVIPTFLRPFFKFSIVNLALYSEPYFYILSFNFNIFWVSKCTYAANKSAQSYIAILLPNKPTRNVIDRPVHLAASGPHLARKILPTGPILVFILH